jgi:DNA-binding NarL/FixJ family response regulator
MRAVRDGLPETPGHAQRDDYSRMISEAALPVRVLVADDQQVVRDGLCLMLGMLGIEVVGTAIDGTDAVRQAAADVPDIVLMDLNMPNCDGVEATRQIVRQQPDVHVVVLTSFSEDENVVAALRAGARGFLTKNASAGEIIQAISTVSAGEAQLDPAAQRMLVEAMVRGEYHAGAGQPQDAAGQGDLAAAGLTEREIEVLTEISAGLSNAEIADKFRITGATVKTHITHLLAKTGSRDRGQLVAYAFRHGVAA